MTVLEHGLALVGAVVIAAPFVAYAVMRASAWFVWRE